MRRYDKRGVSFQLAICHLFFAICFLIASWKLTPRQPPESKLHDPRVAVLTGMNSEYREFRCNVLMDPNSHSSPLLKKVEANEICSDNDEDTPSRVSLARQLP